MESFGRKVIVKRPITQNASVRQNTTAKIFHKRNLGFLMPYSMFSFVIDIVSKLENKILIRAKYPPYFGNLELFFLFP